MGDRSGRSVVCVCLIGALSCGTGRSGVETAGGTDASTVYEGGGGARGAGGDTDAAPLAPDSSTVLPLRPIWNPGSPLGSPGWEGSTIPLCSPQIGVMASQVWSTPGVVYALVTTTCASIGCDSCRCNIPEDSGFEVLYRNTGAGWNSIYQASVGSLDPSADMAGYPDGRVVIGTSGVNEVGGVAVIQANGQSSRILAESASDLAIGGQDLFAWVDGEGDASEDLALLDYNGTSWRQVGAWPSLRRPFVATSGNAVLVAGLREVAAAGSIGGTLAPLSGVPAADYTAGWIYALNDVFLGNGIGELVHYDGATWSSVQSGLDSVDRIWGAPDHTLFLASRTQLVRWKDGVFTTIWTLEGDTATSASIISLWGNSASEVFFSVQDFAFQNYTCGPLFLLRFDGTTVHEF